MIHDAKHLAADGFTGLKDVADIVQEGRQNQLFIRSTLLRMPSALLGVLEFRDRLAIVLLAAAILKKKHHFVDYLLRGLLS